MTEIGSHRYIRKEGDLIVLSTWPSGGQHDDRIGWPEDFNQPFACIVRIEIKSGRRYRKGLNVILF
jgi:hypothetical protein